MMVKGAKPVLEQRQVHGMVRNNYEKIGMNLDLKFKGFLVKMKLTRPGGYETLL